MQKWVKKEISDKSCKKYLDKYMNKIKEIHVVDIRIKHYEMIYKDTSITSNAVSRIKRKIKEFHKTHVFAPADKAANNIVVVGRKYYIEVLRNEIHICLFQHFLKVFKS